MFSQLRGVGRYNGFIKTEKTKTFYTPLFQPGKVLAFSSCPFPVLAELEGERTKVH